MGKRNDIITEQVLFPQPSPAGPQLFFSNLLMANKIMHPANKMKTPWASWLLTQNQRKRKWSSMSVAMELSSSLIMTRRSFVTSRCFVTYHFNLLRVTSKLVSFPHTLVYSWFLLHFYFQGSLGFQGAQTSQSINPEFSLEGLTLMLKLQ